MLLLGVMGTYALGADPTGPLVALLLLAVIYSGAVLSTSAGVAYTGVVVVLVVGVAPQLPLWTPTPHSIRTLGTQLVMLAIAGLGTTALTRRLVLEEAQAQAGQAAAAHLTEIDQLRNDFISTISHDLRTPFTAARAGLGLLETSLGTRLRPDEAQLLGNVRRNVDWLGILINDLLTFNHLEAGVLQLDSQPLDLRTVVTEGLAMVYPLLHEKGQTLEVDLPDPLPCWGDTRRLEQVVVNLLANAHRHTPPGTVIRISGHRSGAHIRLAVQDTGPGISAADQAVIFERFRQVGAPAEGAGLGLAIVQALVGLHGGRVWVESTPPSGTTFYIELACPAAAAGAKEQDA
ncbi:MAG: HAMP domain-containing histidine kinase [Chloroflexota bacterium]|nr:HAMP domain-containing histidine kinase [Chloroflexota bacterium]